jgi:hypothetical protein
MAPRRSEVAARFGAHSRTLGQPSDCVGPLGSIRIRLPNLGFNNAEPPRLGPKRFGECSRNLVVDRLTGGRVQRGQAGALGVNRNLRPERHRAHQPHEVARGGVEATRADCPRG